MTKNDDSSRRRFLAGIVATPIAAGGVVTAAETLSRDDAIRSVGARAVDRDGELTDADLEFPGNGVAFPDETFTYVAADAGVLNTVGRTVGEQVRLRRSDDGNGDEYAVYTLREETGEDGPVVRGNELARARLDLAETDWNDIGDGRLVCPVPNDDVAINDEDGVGVEVDPTVVRTDLSAEEARERDEYVEESYVGEADAIVLSPHGGDVQPGTAAQADRVVDAIDADVSRWGTRGYREGGGAFVRWYVPSYSMSRASYPGLDEVSEHEYEYAVGFHGTCTRNVMVGGQAPRELREEVRDAITDALADAGADARAELGTGAFRVDDDATLVNRLSTRGGIWIGQGKSVRDSYGTEIADRVADVLGTRL